MALDLDSICAIKSNVLLSEDLNALIYVQWMSVYPRGCKQG